jgi:hypothetical protein
LCIVLATLAGMHAHFAHATPPPQVIISAVLPNPGSGPEWVMIENRDSGAANRPLKLFLPWFATGASGVKPIGDVGPPPTLNFIDIAGWQLGDGSVWYAIPQDLPPMPAGAKVQIFFDGQGASANEYDLRDGLMTLHSPAGMVNVLPDTRGNVMLYAGDVNTADNLRARYEWGVGIE